MPNNGNLPDITDIGGPSELMKQLNEQPDKYGALRPLPSRKVPLAKIEGQNMDMNEIIRQVGYSKPIADMSALASKIYGFMRDGNIASLEEKHAVLGVMEIHDMIMTCDCLFRKMRYDLEENEIERIYDRIEPERRPTGFAYQVYDELGGAEDDPLMKDWIDSLLEDNAVADETEEAEEPVKNKGGRPRKAQRPQTNLPLVEDLINRWGSADAFLLQVLLVEEDRGIDYAERYYDDCERMHEIKEEVEFAAALLPSAENTYFWCRLRQFLILRERSYDVARGYPVHDYSEVLSQIDQGANIHDVANKMDWAFKIAYRRIQGSMLDGQEHRLFLASMLAQQIPIGPQMANMAGNMMGPGAGFWQNGQMNPAGQPVDQGDEQGQPDKRGAIFGFFKGGGQPQSGAQPAGNKQPRNNRRKAGSRN